MGSKKNTGTKKATPQKKTVGKQPEKDTKKTVGKQPEKDTKKTVGKQPEKDTKKSTGKQPAKDTKKPAAKEAEIMQRIVDASEILNASSLNPNIDVDALRSETITNDRAKEIFMQAIDDIPKNEENDAIIDLLGEKMVANLYVELVAEYTTKEAQGKGKQGKNAAKTKAAKEDKDSGKGKEYGYRVGTNNHKVIVALQEAGETGLTMTEIRALPWNEHFSSFYSMLRDLAEKEAVKKEGDRFFWIGGTPEKEKQE